MPKNTTLLNIPLYNGTYSDFFGIIQNPVSKTLVFTPNPEILVRASRDSEFMEILGEATYNVPDANGLYVGYMMQEGKSFLMAGLRVFFMKKLVQAEYGELIKGSDLVRDILEFRHREEWSNPGKQKGIPDSDRITSWAHNDRSQKRKILVIDRKNQVPKNDLEVKKAEVQKDLKNIIESKYPWTEIFVVFAWEKNPEEIATLIKTENIDYVFSCVGMKAQEQLLIEIWAHIPESQKVVWLGVGASIDFLLGLQKRAPILFQNLWLEWLYRLITQPRIRARRIWDAVYHFPRLIRNSSKD